MPACDNGVTRTLKVRRVVSAVIPATGMVTEPLAHFLDRSIGICGGAVARAPRRRHRARRLVGHRRPQVAERALRQRPGVRARRRVPARGDGVSGDVDRVEKAGEQSFLVVGGNDHRITGRDPRMCAVHRPRSRPRRVVSAVATVTSSVLAARLSQVIQSK